jgi:metal-responsive CopG/Arc/MetJ family transcriptional regulator
MKTAVSIPDPVFDAAERLAHRLGITRSELYQRALRHFLESRSHAVVRETLDAVYGESPEDSRLDATVEFAQGMSLPEDDW